MKHTVTIQPYTEDSSREIAELFYVAVHSINPEAYSDQQKHAWAPKPIDYKFWQQRLNIKRPYLAFIDHQLSGFIELESDGHIDCLYTHPRFQGQGVASLLFDHIFSIAKASNMARLYVEASMLAKPFFEKRGFQLIA
ncbi:GNAT family N-acetyltransferase [Bermanella marisrubri]|uniref:Histone acetyltransferase HPA2/related acetyltransferase n=1 Tax=Bermanella marisrubri TaxID=207949 RepID=Q1N316_9GAMM|nr:GNAT family N-acetyltransferase [Bermanella marisrubri]EAT12503.1 Histone acetyltransferase HPA2/related acetyltransferase [Oceanobacter sp. RED65] [Bermanella marisrubri]QIZ84936.1 GNAT family N-acetyltransferase [Bermanella marisrubri]